MHVDLSSPGTSCTCGQPATTAYLKEVPPNGRPRKTCSPARRQRLSRFTGNGFREPFKRKLRTHMMKAPAVREHPGAMAKGA
jgi:hypothetical protein